MVEIVLVLLIFGYGVVKGELVGYLYHRALHSPRLGLLHEKHMQHHSMMYPLGHLVSDTYKHPPGFSTVALFAPIFITMAVLHYWLLPVYLFVSYLIAISAAAFVNESLHRVLHIRHPWVARFKWFTRLRLKHFRHHVDMETNYGIWHFAYDRLFRTHWGNRAVRTGGVEPPQV